MTTTGTQLAPQAEPSTRERSPLAYLIHALNQPLTGLQCSLELAASTPRRADQYVHTLREGLELTARMRALVEAMRELSENVNSEPDQAQPFELNLLLRDAIDDLIPVARQKDIQISFASTDAIEIEADRRQLAALTFRLLDSVLSLAAAGSELRIALQHEAECAYVSVSWTPGPVPRHSPFSPPELGLIVARAGWEQVSGERTSFSSGGTQNCAIRLPLRRATGTTLPSHLPAPTSTARGLL
jgi:signal transduction histidine kinase